MNAYLWTFNGILFWKCKLSWSGLLSKNLLVEYLQNKLLSGIYRVLNSNYANFPPRHIKNIIIFHQGVGGWRIPGKVLKFRLKSPKWNGGHDPPHQGFILPFWLLNSLSTAMKVMIPSWLYVHDYWVQSSNVKCQDLRRKVLWRHHSLYTSVDSTAYPLKRYRSYETAYDSFIIGNLV